LTIDYRTQSRLITPTAANQDKRRNSLEATSEQEGEVIRGKAVILKQFEPEQCTHTNSWIKPFIFVKDSDERASTMAPLTTKFLNKIKHPTRIAQIEIKKQLIKNSFGHTSSLALISSQHSLADRRTKNRSELGTKGKVLQPLVQP
jgi:hypothetical protein